MNRATGQPASEDLLFSEEKRSKKDFCPFGLGAAATGEAHHPLSEPKSGSPFCFFFLQEKEGLASPPPATLDGWAAARMGLRAPLTRPDLEAWQLARLGEVLARVRLASPFYRARRDWPAIPPATLTELARFPFTTAEDLARADPPLAALPASRVARVVTLATSGTSGPPKRICCAAEDLEDSVDFFHHGLALFVRPGEGVAIDFAALHPDSLGDMLVRALDRLGARPWPVPGGLGTAELVAFLRARPPAVILGLPGRLLAAARLSAAEDGAPLRLRAALASADVIPPELEPALRRHWGCELFAHWGMTETGFGGAVECACHAGQHLRETDLVVEIVDPASGEPLGPGEEGEIVVTTLGRRAMPLIRYRTGDRGRLLGGVCACGSVLGRLAREVRRLVPREGKGTVF
jgi:phenylacetate-coenzyme A ligase PaaK-like adenylate-forming protein